MLFSLFDRGIGCISPYTKIDNLNIPGHISFCCTYNLNSVFDTSSLPPIFSYSLFDFVTPLNLLNVLEVHHALNLLSIWITDWWFCWCSWPFCRCYAALAYLGFLDWWSAYHHRWVYICLNNAWFYCNFCFLGWLWISDLLEQYAD